MSRSKRNIGVFDRLIRLLGGCSLAMGGTILVGGSAGIVLALGSVIPLLSFLTGFCPLYAGLGLSTAGQRLQESPYESLPFNRTEQREPAASDYPFATPVALDPDLNLLLSTYDCEFDMAVERIAKTFEDRITSL